MADRSIAFLRVTTEALSSSSTSSASGHESHTDPRESGVCNDKCGCSAPCPGGSSCRCYTATGVPSADDPCVEHKKCSCGEHCGCNPCTCTKKMNTAAGCKCAEGCTCESCA